MSTRSDRVAILTCRDIPEPDFDEDVLMSALDGRVEARLVAWDDEGATPAEYDLCVLRSTWNYPLAPDAFTQWVRRASEESVLVNPADVVLWNLHKQYLIELEERGHPVVPTALVRRGEAVSIEELVGTRGWNDVVIKPAVSAGSYKTRRFTGDWADAQCFLDELAAEGDVLVQRFMESVATVGETCAIWIDGEWTHAIRKEPRFSGDDESVTLLPEIPADLLELAQRITNDVPGWPDALLYGRADFIRDDDRWCLSELELVEPSLFLLQHPPACERLVAGIERRCT